MKEGTEESSGKG
jgi:T-complex protein 1 subunit eta